MAVLHTRAWGPADAEPVVLVHGVTGFGGRFRRLAVEGLPERRALAVDLRGHGHSTWDPPWHLERHVADLRETLDDAGLARADVVGHSFGGLLAMRLAAAAPERVSRLALIDPAVGLPPALAGEYADGARADESWAGEAEARKARRALRPAHARDTVDEDLAAFLRRDPDGRYRLRYSRAAVVAAYAETARPPVPLAGLAGPVLLVAARRAPFVTKGLRESLRRNLGPRLAEVSIDAGHVLYWDAFDELVAALRPFVGLAP